MLKSIVNLWMISITDCRSLFFKRKCFSEIEEFAFSHGSRAIGARLHWQNAAFRYCEKSYSEGLFLNIFEGNSKSGLRFSRRTKQMQNFATRRVGQTDR